MPVVARSDVLLKVLQVTRAPDPFHGPQHRPQVVPAPRLLRVRGHGALNPDELHLD